MSRFVRQPLLLFVLLSFSSCGNYLVSGVRVAWAKQLFQQGSYQESLLYYLNAEQNLKRNILAEASIGDSKFLALRRVQYNIGLIYSALGQSRAAIERWQFVLERGGISRDEPLQFSLLYNTSLLYSQIGENKKARRNLVQALQLRPDHKGARQALELSLKYLQQEQLSEQLQQKNSYLQEPSSTQSGISDEQILNYVLRQVKYRFKREAPMQQILRNDW